MNLKLPALAIVATLLLAGVAIGKTNKVKGKLTGDANSGVSMKVVTSRKGVAKRIKSLKFTDIDYECQAGPPGERKSLTLGSFKIKAAYPPDSGPNSALEYTFFSGQKKLADGTTYRVSGTVNKKGTKVKGNVVYSFLQRETPTEKLFCGTGADGRAFKAKRK